MHVPDLQREEPDVRAALQRTSAQDGSAVAAHLESWVLSLRRRSVGVSGAVRRWVEVVLVWSTALWWRGKGTRSGFCPSDRRISSCFFPFSERRVAGCGSKQPLQDVHSLVPADESGSWMLG